MTAAALESVFRHIAETRMAGLPIVNPALGVEAVDFRDWQGEHFGVLITPWFMNLLCLPGEAADWPPMTGGSAHSRILPGGEFRFLAGEEDGIGPYLSCSLFSPMGDFADMDAARAVAREIMAQLFRPDEPAGSDPDGMRSRLDQPLSRRGFFAAFAPREPTP